MADHTSTWRVPMLAVQVVWGVVGFVCAGAAMEALLDRAGAHPLPPEPFRTKIDACLTADPPYDTVLVGTSHVWHQIDPAVFDRAAAAHGIQTRTFNAGFGGLKFYESRYVVDALLTDPRCRLRHLVIEPDLRLFPVKTLVHTQRGLALHDLGRMPAIMEMVWRDGSSSVARDSIYHLQLAAFRLVNYGAASARWLGTGERVPEREGVLGPAGDGYVPLADPEALPAVPLYERHPGARRLSAFALAMIRGVLQSARAHGVRAILLVPPTENPKAVDYFAAVAQASAAGEIAAPLIDFSDRAAHPEFHRSDGYRDDDHLCRGRTEAFSAAAGAAVAETLATPADGAW